MKNKAKTVIAPEDRPNSEQLKEELRRVNKANRFSVIVKSTVYLLITAAAASVLVATLWMPVLQIYGSSMTPTLEEGEIVVSVKGNKFDEGDIIGFYYGNKLLVKRFIAGPSDWIDIDKEGNVYVNSKKLDEPYVSEKSFGESDVTFPYQVPEGKYFVLGDHRSVSVDSRNSTMGCISEEQIVGKIVFTIWPLNKFGKIT